MKNSRALLIPALFLICLNLFGQEIKEYRGEMKMDEDIPTMKGYSGEGYYQYYLSPEGKRVKHGKYEFGSSFNAIISTNAFISGQFVNGKKNGKWTGGLASSIDSDFDNLARMTESDLSILVMKAMATYANRFIVSYEDDKMQGPCQFMILQAGNLQIIDCEFNNNHLSGEISFSFPNSDKKRTVKGQFDEDGLADGVWTDTATPYITYYEYSHGFRKKALRYDDSTGETEQLDNEECAKVETLFDYPTDGAASFRKFFSNADACFMSYGKRMWASSTPVEIEVDESGIPIEDSIPYQLVGRVKPEFQGGNLDYFVKWVNDNLVYPKSAKDNGIQGRVTLEFVVHSNGKLADVKVLRGVEPELDKEAVRVVSESPLWTPGYQRGVPIAVKCTISVVFQIK